MLCGGMRLLCGALVLRALLRQEGAQYFASASEPASTTGMLALHILSTRISALLDAFDEVGMFKLPYFF